MRQKQEKSVSLDWPVGMSAFLICMHSPNSSVFLVQNSEAENLVLIEMLDANEDGEVDSFEWTTMLSQVWSRVDP